MSELDERKELAKKDSAQSAIWAIAGWGAALAYQTAILDRLTGLEADVLDQKMKLTREALKTHFRLEDHFLKDAKLTQAQLTQKNKQLKAAIDRIVKTFENVVRKVLDENLIENHLKVVDDATAKRDNGWKKISRPPTRGLERS